MATQGSGGGSGSSGIGEVGLLGVWQLVELLLVTHLPHTVLGVLDTNAGFFLGRRGQHGAAERSQGVRGKSDILDKRQESFVKYRPVIIEK